MAKDGVFRADDEGTKVAIRPDRVSAVVLGGMVGRHYAVVDGVKVELVLGVAEALLERMSPTRPSGTPKKKRKRPKLGFDYAET